MKKIGFIGVYDKIDLVLNVAKLLILNNKKVLVVDATQNQKSRYIVPVINPTRSYVTDFEGMDVAIGFSEFSEIKKYLGIEENQGLDYDFVLIDTDDKKGIDEFEVLNSEKIYYITSFDAYSLKKGIELLSQISQVTYMTKIFFSKRALIEEEEYFDYLSLGIKVEWSEDKIYFLLENGDQAATIENQRLQKIKFRNLSNEYKDNLAFMVHSIEEKLNEKQLRNIVKNN